MTEEAAHRTRLKRTLGVPVADDAKVQGFRGESRFTTWAYKFVIFEVSTKIGRHFWRRSGVPLDQEDWDRLPDRAGIAPDERAEWSDLVAAIRRAVMRI